MTVEEIEKEKTDYGMVELNIHHQYLLLLPSARMRSEGMYLSVLGARFESSIPH